jgi:acetyl esterase/lipase
MRLLLLLLGVGLSFSVFAQCENERYREFQFAEVTTTTGVEYGNNLTYQGAAQVLTMDIYQPTGDAQVDRPLVMIAHGGFFVGGSSDGTDVVPMCTDLAKMGYVVASIKSFRSYDGGCYARYTRHESGDSLVQKKCGRKW